MDLSEFRSSREDAIERLERYYKNPGALVEQYRRLVHAFASPICRVCSGSLMIYDEPELRWECPDGHVYRDSKMAMLMAIAMLRTANGHFSPEESQNLIITFRPEISE